MFNTLLKISYDGTDYSGFQFQINAPTIQDNIENALKVIYKQPVRIIGAGRTDAGVHARGQTATYNAPFEININNLPHAINALLPKAIVITGAKVVEAEFHARYDAKRKIYTYSIDRAEHPQVFKRLYSWHLPDPLDIDLMLSAARIFEGTHNFVNFQAAGNLTDDTFRTLYRVEIREIDNSILQIYFEGSGFLYKMVRLITGTLVRAGKSQLKTVDIEEALSAGENAVPGIAGHTVPAQGLCLEEVVYDHC